MNLENLIKTADLIERGMDGYEFCMHSWASPTEEGLTRGCIAMWACLAVDITDFTRMIVTAREVLGLTNEEASDLFTDRWGSNLSYVTKQQAVDRLKELADGCMEESMVEELEVVCV